MEKLYIKTQSKNSFFYTRTEFISFVREYPILWSHDHPMRDDAELIANLWLEVAMKLISHFHTATSDEKKEIARILQYRWKTTRNCFYNQEKKTKNSGEKILEFLRGQNKSETKKKKKKEKVKNQDTVTKENAPKVVDGASVVAGKISINETTLAAKKFCLNPEPQTACPNNKNDLKKTKHYNVVDDDVQIMEEDSMESENKNDSKKAKHYNVVDDDVQIMEEDSMESDTATESASESSISSQTAASAPPQETNDQVTQNATEVIIPTTTSNSIPKDIDVEQLFFDSIKPFIRNWNKEQRLSLQIGVLNLIRDFGDD